MSCEKGDKFVLEIAEVLDGKHGNLYRMKDFASLVFDENGLQRLRRIRESDEEQLAKARAEGAEEAWTFRNEAKYRPSSKEYDWYRQSTKAYYEMTYAEAKADFEKWKSTQKRELQVGDVVSCYNAHGVLLQIINGSHGVVWKSSGCGYYNLKDMYPTGEHIDISPIFEAMK